MNARRPLLHAPRAALLAGLALAGGTAFGHCTTARADDAGGTGEAHDDLEKVRAKMEEILRLMRDNEQALLEASRGSGKKPEGATVSVPEVPRTDASPAPGTPPKAAPPTPPPRAGGEEARKRVEDLLAAAGKSSGRIPHELEELVRLLPH